MSSLTAMSAEEISKLLDEYGIKHGPVVGELVRTLTLTLTTNMAPDVEAPQWLQELKIKLLQ